MPEMNATTNSNKLTLYFNFHFIRARTLVFDMQSSAQVYNEEKVSKRRTVIESQLMNEEVKNWWKNTLKDNWL